MSRTQRTKISANLNAYGLEDYVDSLQSYHFQNIFRASLATREASQSCILSLSEREGSSTHVSGLKAFVVVAERVVVNCGRASSKLSKLLV